MKIGILGVDFDNVTIEEAVQKSFSFLEDERGHYVVTPNPEIVYMSSKDKKLAQALNGADLVLPDGIGVIYASKLLKRPLKEKVAGIDFGDKLAGALAENRKTLFLLGAKPGIADKAAKRLCEKYPELLIAGTADGYFKEDGPIIEKINASGADVVFACLGAPKQELWMRENKDRLDARLMVGLGGSLDVFAGEVMRAPELWIRLGLEWLYRLLKEPWRIKRMMKIPLFLFAVIGSRRSGGLDGR